jgi:hypothetical protein
MTLEERIKIIDTISDIFLDLGKYFKVEYEFGYDYYVSIEDKYDSLMTLLPSVEEATRAKFRITSKNSVNRDWDNLKKQAYLKKTTKYLLDSIPACEERIRQFLPEYNCTFRKFVVISVKLVGLLIVPLDNSESMKKEDIERLKDMGISYTSYQDNFSMINKYDEIGHATINIAISEKSLVKEVGKKIKKFRFF